MDRKKAVAYANKYVMESPNGSMEAAIENSECGEDGDHWDERDSTREYLVDALASIFEGWSTPSDEINLGITVDGDPVILSVAEARTMLRVYARRDREDFREELHTVRAAVVG